MKSQRSFEQINGSFLLDKRPQDQIINDYKEVKYNQDSICFPNQQIEYSPLPEGTPQQLKQKFKYGIYIQNSSFYDMLTFAIFQHLLRQVTEKKMLILNKLKNIICNNSFLQFASYIKGLLLLGLQKMIENSKDTSKPIADVLVGSEKILAFAQCWKEILIKFDRSKRNCNTQINSDIIKVFALFFDADFYLYTKADDQIKLQVVKSKCEDKNKTFIITVLLSNSFQTVMDQKEFQRKQSFSQISSIYGNWSYFIFLNHNIDYNQLRGVKGRILSEKQSKKIKLKSQKTILREFPQLFSIDEENIQIMQPQNLNMSKQSYGLSDYFKKGRQLIKQMKQFANKIGFF